MTERVIDYRRGVRKRVHLKTGMDVFMYKDEPGVFLNAYGKPVSDKVAAAAGFDVEALSKQKVKKERMAEAMKSIEAELDAEPQGDKVLLKRGDYIMVDMGLDRVHVKDEDEGHVVTTLPIPKELGEQFMEQLAPDDEPEYPGEKAKAAEKEDFEKEGSKGKEAVEKAQKKPTEAAKDIDPGPELGGKNQTKGSKKESDNADAKA